MQQSPPQPYQFKRLNDKRFRTQGYKHIPYLNKLKSTTEKFDGDSKLAKAYEVALDTRKFEIELYWKRATYFWAIAAVVLGAIGLVVANSIKDGRLTTYPILLMLETLSCVGFIVTKAWQYVNLGGKFWQHNWELHVDILEQEVMFPLFRTVLAEHDSEVAEKARPRTEAASATPKAKRPSGELTVVFSPSKVNEFLGRFLNTIFIVIGLVTFSLIVSKAGLVAYVAATFGISDLKKLLISMKMWLIPFVALVPLAYTFYFWARMAGDARTTTLRRHSLNVTQREIKFEKRIRLPIRGEKGLYLGIRRVFSEMTPRRKAN